MSLESSVIPLESPDPIGVQSLLWRVADQLQRVLVSYTESLTEPTDTGYLQGYELELQSPDGERERRLVFVAMEHTRSDESGALQLSMEGVSSPASVWLYPADPTLPALRRVTDVSATAEVFGALGIPGTPTAVRVVSYRPGRRAVVRVDTDTQSLFLKVVEPGKAESISERHDLLRANGLPVPRLLGWSPEGIIALAGLPGVEAQTVIAQIVDHAAFLDQVEFVCSLVAAAPSVNTARPSLFRRLDWYVDRLTELLPEESERIRTVGIAIQRLGESGLQFDYTPVTIHGDLHMGQIFVDPQETSVIAGILDIDTAGVGDPADDAGAFYAHLVALAESLTERDLYASQQSLRLAMQWRSRWRRNLNAGYADRASAIAATHLLGHALQPRVHNPTEVSRRLLAHAEALVGAD